MSDWDDGWTTQMDFDMICVWNMLLQIDDAKVVGNGNAIDAFVFETLFQLVRNSGGFGWKV